MKQILPTIYVNERTMPRAWERAIVETFERGMHIPTQYDKPGDPNSRDVTAFIVVREPLAEPRYHMNYPGGVYDLERYVAEMCDGIDDAARRAIGCYTYHERLASYQVPTPTFSGEYPTVNQLDKVLDDLEKCVFTRRAQVVTWQPWIDPGHHEPPCLRSMWFRVIRDPETGLEHLCMNVDIRSNDSFKAAFMNMYAFIGLQARMALCLSQRIGRPIEVGQYTHKADSFHLYGAYMRGTETKPGVYAKDDEVRNFIRSISDDYDLSPETIEDLGPGEFRRGWESRTRTTAQWTELLDEARARLRNEFNLPEEWPLRSSFDTITVERG